MDFFKYIFDRNSKNSSFEEKKFTWEKKKEDLVEEYYFKLLVVGASGCGKTSIIHRFVYDDFSKSYNPTIGVDMYNTPSTKFRTSRSYIKKFEKSVRVKILDVPQSELKGPHVDFLLNECHGVILVFDVTNDRSIKAVDQWRRRIPKGYLCLLVGNKADKSLNHIIQPNELSDYVLNGDYIGWYLTSAKNKVDPDVFDSFDYMICCICKRMQNRFNGFPKFDQSHLFSVSKEQFYKDKRKFKKISKKRNVFKTSVVEERIEKNPFQTQKIESGYAKKEKKEEKNSSNHHHHHNGKSKTGEIKIINKKESKQDRFEAFNELFDEFTQFYIDLRKRTKEYKQTSQNKEMDDVFNLLLKEIEYERQHFTERIENIIETNKQTELLNNVNKRIFMEIKREFCTNRVGKWIRLFDALRNHLVVSGGEKLSLEKELKEELIRVLKKHSIISRGGKEEKNIKSFKRGEEENEFHFHSISEKLEESFARFPTILDIYKKDDEMKEQENTSCSFGFCLNN